MLSELSGAELKVLLYIIRRTFGFKKSADDISLAQLTGGITTRDGRTLDRGTGLHQSTVLTALRSLTEKNVIVATRNQSREKGDEPTTYSLNVRTPLPENPGRGSRKIRLGRAGESGTQDTVEQDTEGQDPRFDGTTPEPVDEDAAAIRGYVEDFAREFRDRAPLSASQARAVNLYRASGVALDGFVGRMYEARQRTQAATKVRNRMAYWFECLENPR